MPNTLADILAGSTQPSPEGYAPLLNANRSRFPAEFLEALGLGAARLGEATADPNQADYEPLLRQGRSRFPLGLLESMGLGAARN